MKYFLGFCDTVGGMFDTFLGLYFLIKFRDLCNWFLKLTEYLCEWLDKRDNLHTLLRISKFECIVNLNLELCFQNITPSECHLASFCTSVFS